MDRDVLLLLLAGAVLLNTGLLILVAVLRLTHDAAAVPSASTRPAWPASAPALAPPTALEVAVTTSPAIPGTEGAATASSAAEARLEAERRTPPPEAVASSPSPEVMAPAPAPPVDTAETAEPRAAEPASPAPRPGRRTGEPTTRASRARSGGRPRRFTMPDLDDDHERATRSIAAFLGEPVARSSGAHPHRRRHRARRPAGSSSRTDIVLVLSGDARDARIVHAVAAALRDASRESDEVVELAGGRLRVSLDAEPGGAELFLDRARTVVRPWLGLFGQNVELRVERGLPTDRATTVAS